MVATAKYLLIAIVSLATGIGSGIVLNLAFRRLFPFYGTQCGEEHMGRWASALILVMMFVAVLCFICPLSMLRQKTGKGIPGEGRTIRFLAIAGGGVVLSVAVTALWVALYHLLIGEFYRECGQRGYGAEPAFLACQIPLYFLFCAAFLWSRRTPRRVSA